MNNIHCQMTDNIKKATTKSTNVAAKVTPIISTSGNSDEDTDTFIGNENKKCYKEIDRVLYKNILLVINSIRSIIVPKGSRLVSISEFKNIRYVTLQNNIVDILDNLCKNNLEFLTTRKYDDKKIGGVIGRSVIEAEVEPDPEPEPEPEPEAENSNENDSDSIEAKQLKPSKPKQIKKLTPEDQVNFLLNLIRSLLRSIGYKLVTRQYGNLRNYSVVSGLYAQR